MQEQAVEPYPHYLSKSLFIRGRQCHKSLWLHKNKPELKDQISDSQASLFQSGTDVGILAQQLFPGGIEVPYEGLSHQEQVALTASEISKGTKTIYEATFLHNGIFIKIDILHRGSTGWEIFEVKASTEVKGVHLYDAALQYQVLVGMGMAVTSANIVHIDNTYTRHGEVEIRQLFAIKDVTADVKELQPYVVEELAAQRLMLSGEMPFTDIGPCCSDPYECDFTGHCWSHIPDNSVFDLRGKGIDRFALYRQGIIKQTDIPAGTLNKAQHQQVSATIEQRDSLDQEKLKNFLDEIWYPICFLDFETFMSAVPLFDNSRPYQQIPFQYSLHIMDKPGANLQHYEFLAQPGQDPRSELLDTLLKIIPKDACILAWNQSFEISVIRKLGELFPEKQKRVELLIENFRDLMAPFRSRNIYLWQSKGSYSIKSILPILVPELSYKDMDIADGGMAMDAYHQMGSIDDHEELMKLRNALLEYCKLDTLAMVRILEKMRALAND